MPIDHDERTEPATPRRRMEARQKGQIARSQDLSAALLLLAGFVSLRWLGPDLWGSLLGVMTLALAPEQATELIPIHGFVRITAYELVRRLAPFLLILLAVIAATMLVQIGPLFTLHPVTPSLSKLNPLAGLQRMFSIRSSMVAAVSVAKLLVVGLVAFLTVMQGADAILFATSLGFHELVRVAADRCVSLGIRLSIVLVLLALLDYAWQRFRHERDLRMTKEEVKDELRSMEGDPTVKRRRRQIQLQMSLHRLRKDVPKADVVVTNPTHYAVALRYDAETMLAPKVIAKGADYLALRIRQLATECGIPIVERKPLARALFDSVEVGHYVPERFYQAIAEILAYIYELTGRSSPSSNPRRMEAQLS